MGKLSNPKHEAFAQYLADGLPANQAYERAGYNYHEPNASRLRSNEKVVERLSELQERAAKRHDITREKITEMLITAHDSAKAEGDRSNQRQAANDLAKLHGLIVDLSKVEAENVNYHVQDAPLSDDAWEQEFGEDSNSVH